MNAADLAKYLPLALRFAATVAAALAPVVASRGKIDFETLALAATAGAAAWKRWHPSASSSAAFGAKADPPDGPAADSAPLPTGDDTPPSETP